MCPMTDLLPREKLCELIATYGQTLCDDPRRCEALLRDLCAANRREIRALVSALRERVATDLLAASEGVPREVLRARLTQRLQDNLGLAEEIARWAVDSWALALGKLSWAELGAVAGSSSTASSPAPSAPSRRRPLMLAGLGVGVGLVVVLATALFYGGERKSISTQPPAQLDQGTNHDQARPYPFGRDAIGYIKSIERGYIYQAKTHSYCTAFAKDAAQYCVAEHNGRVDGIQIDLWADGLTTPLGTALFLTDLGVFRLWEERDGKEYLRGSSYTSVEVGNRLVKAWRELEAGHFGEYSETFGRYIFVVNRKLAEAFVFDTDSDSYKRAHQQSGTP